MQIEDDKFENNKSTDQTFISSEGSSTISNTTIP
jgi:hypothetical protein